MLRAIVIDDEQTILEELCSLIKQNNTKIVGEYNNPIEALHDVDTLAPDIAFLDIEMPEMNGIDLAKNIHNASPNTQIVFVTAYNEYALSAFGVNAIHYILKPIDGKNVEEAIERVKNIKKMGENLGVIDSVYLTKSKLDSNKICLQDNGDFIVISLSDILYLTSKNSNSIIATKNGEYKSKKGLQFWEKYLGNYDFIRCHKSYIVNANYIYKLIHVLGEYKELLLNYCSIRIPISRRKVNSIKSWLGIV